MLIPLLVCVASCWLSAFDFELWILCFCIGRLLFATWLWALLIALAVCFTRDCFMFLISCSNVTKLGK